MEVMGEGGESEGEGEGEVVVTRDQRGSRESGEVDEVESQVGKDDGEDEEKDGKVEEEEKRTGPSRRRSARVEEAPLVDYSRPRRAYKSKAAGVKKPSPSVHAERPVVETPGATSRRSTRVVKVELKAPAPRPAKRSLELETPSRRSKRVRS
jgi:hypothetical protein